MSKIEEAVACFKEGFICSQAVLSAYSEQFGLDRDTALKIADGFGGGMGRMGETCGAVTGALMVIGLKHGRTVVENTQTHEMTYDLVNEFVRGFKSRNKYITCQELLKCDLSTPEGLQSARQQNLFNTACPGYVRDAAEIIEDILGL
ncbi:MAG: C_GCAxxG_C_C family protein [Dehalococcoidales bacterium]|nr:MAG: C_GCAxxG_C_C family protein [Dehalococcoidales bacterium]